MLDNAGRCIEPSASTPDDRRALQAFIDPVCHDIDSGAPSSSRVGERVLAFADARRGLLGGDVGADKEVDELYAEVQRRSGKLGGAALIELEVEQVRSRRYISAVCFLGGMHLSAARIPQVQEEEQEAEAEAEVEAEQEQEKSQEQEQVAAQEPSRLNFSREDEAHRPWALKRLYRAPDSGGGQPFYPWSRFAIYRGGSQKARPLKWPSRLWMSANYFRPEWTLRSHRRLKNVVCLMEWAPRGVGGSSPSGPSSPAVVLDTDQAARVRASFGFFDEDHDGVLTASELATLGRSVDLHTVEQDASGAAPDVGALPDGMVVPLVQEQLRSHMDGPGGRYWVVLSLAEAESLRGALHISAQRGDGRLVASGGPADADADSPPLVALHTHSVLLDAVNHTAERSSYEVDVVRACVRFLSSATDYAPREQHLLLRCLQANEPKARQASFTEVRDCRRRRRAPWEGTEAAAVLTEPNEFTLFEHRALLGAAARRLRARGLSLPQARVSPCVSFARAPAKPHAPL